MMLSFDTINFSLLWVFAFLNLLLSIALLRRYDQLLLLPSMLTALEEKLTRGAPAPAFQAETLDGEFVTLMNYQQKSTLFIFLSPTCAPCIEKIPAIHTLAEAGKMAGVTVVLVSTEGDKASTTAFVRQHNVTLPVLLAPREKNPFADDYKAFVTPTYCLVDANGYVAASDRLDTNWEKIAKAWTPETPLPLLARQSSP